MVPYQHLVDASPDAIVVHQDGRIVYANETAVRWLGAQYADQVRGHSVTAFLHPSSVESALARMASLRHAGDVTRPAEAVLVRLDGTTFDVEVVVALTFWADAPAYHVTIRDLTGSRAAERITRYQAALVDHVGEAIVATTVTGLVTKWNHAAERIYRRPAAATLALHVETAVGAPLDPAAIVAEGGVVHVTHYNADDEALTVRVSAAALDSGFVLVCTDETKTYGTERLLRTIINSLGEGIVVVDDGGRVVSANPAAERILGVPKTALTDDGGRVMYELPVCDADRRPIPPEHHPVVEAVRTGKTVQGDVVGVDRRDGRRVWLRMSCRRLDDDHPSRTAILVSFADITTEREASERLSHRATHDALTGLPNRLAVLSEISESLGAEGDRRLGAVLFIDLDNLKAVNDSFGHDCGDELLKHVGRTLRSSMAARDVIGRLGGDEFVILVTGDVGDSDVTNIVERLERRLAEPTVLGTAPVRTRASIGATVVVRDDLRSAIEILRDADTAMYVAKSARRQSDFGANSSVVRLLPEAMRNVDGVDRLHDPHRSSG